MLISFLRIFSEKNEVKFVLCVSKADIVLLIKWIHPLVLPAQHKICGFFSLVKMTSNRLSVVEKVGRKPNRYVYKGRLIACI